MIKNIVFRYDKTSNNKSEDILNFYRDQTKKHVSK